MKTPSAPDIQVVGQSEFIGQLPGTKNGSMEVGCGPGLRTSIRKKQGMPTGLTREWRRGGERRRGAVMGRSYDRQSKWFLTESSWRLEKVSQSKLNHKEKLFF